MPFSTFAGYLWSVNICISGCLAWRIDWCVLSPPGCCCGSHVVPPKQMNYVMRYRHPCISSVACSTTPHRIYNGLCLGFPHDVSVLSGLFFSLNIVIISYDVTTIWVVLFTSIIIFSLVWFVLFTFFVHSRTFVA